MGLLLLDLELELDVDLVVVDLILRGRLEERVGERADTHLQIMDDFVTFV